MKARDLEALNFFTDKVLAYRRGDDKPTPQQAAEASGGDFTFLEFFAGGGMAHAGLGLRWQCLFANDFDHKKAATYEANWGVGTIVSKDVADVSTDEIRGHADLAWASFPCQDLSLAGMGAGLKRGSRSGTFWPFWDLMTRLKVENRAPRLIVLENVCGTLTSHGGNDFTAIADALSEQDYRFGAVVMDAVEFVPQSRPRLFIIAVADGLDIPSNLLSPESTLIWHTKALRVAHMRLKGKAAKNWLWWKLPAPPRRETRFADLVEENPTSVKWHTRDETANLLAMMSARNIEKVEDAKRSGQLLVGTVYKRTRLDEKEQKVQRAEVRFDDVAGCLRTSTGGSSRQLILVIKGDEVRSRLLSSREAARLMGLSDRYKLPKSYNEAYHLAGDGVVVPVVRYLADNLLEPILENTQSKVADARSSHSVRAQH